MKKVHGICLTVSSFERGLWFDHDSRDYQPKGWGIKLNLVVGKLIRPIPYFWHPKFWQGDDAYNPWKGGKFVFVLRIPILPFFYLSLALGKLGVYIGTKTFKMSFNHNNATRYGKWGLADEFGPIDNPNIYLQFTATMRRTRWK